MSTAIRTFDEELLQSVFRGTGESQQICRGIDWSATPLGPVKHWTVSLRTAVAIVLGCSFPAILVWGPDRVQLYNDRYIPLIGNRHPGALGASTHSSWPELRDQQEPMFERVYAGEPVELVEARYLLDRAGVGVAEEFFFDATFIPVPDEHGVIQGSLSTLVDVTARVTARVVDAERELLLTELAEEHERLVTAQEVTNVGSWETHFPTFDVYWSAQTFRIFGLDPSNFIPTHAAFLSHVHPADSALVDAAFVASFDTRAVCTVEHRVVRADGSVARVEERWKTFVDAAGVPTRAVGTCQDVTARWAIDEERRMLATALAQLSEEGVAVIDPEGRFIYTNAAHRRLFGYTVEQLESLRVDHFVPDATAREQLAEMLQCAQQGKSWSGLVQRQRLDDGRISSFDMIFGAVPDSAQTRFIVISRDATERLARDQHLRRVERAAGMGTMLAGVAHELNNPLTAIMGCAELLLGESRCEDDQEDMKIILRETRRMSDIVTKLRLVAPAPKAPVDWPMVSLNDIVQQVLVTRSYPLATRNIKVVTELADDIPTIRADRAELEQMLLNLVVNAEQALVDGGTDAPTIVIRTASTPKGYSLSVIDNGPGIPRTILGRIFDPFFTTKEPGDGTGLGLSLVQTIVTEHLGEIHVESEPGRGATFHIEFASIPSAAARMTPRPATLATRRLRVLVVDDEDGVRRVVARLFQRRGHVVQTAGDGGEALTLLEVADLPHDAIVSDLRMPGLGGFELLRRLEGLSNSMAKRVVFLTGDDSSPDVARMVEESGVPVLTKPSGLTGLVTRVEEMAEALSRKSDSQ